MKIRLFFVGALSLVLMGGAAAQQPGTPPGSGQSGPGQRGERGWGGMMGGRGVLGSVTEVAGDHYTIKTETGETYTVHFSANTRIMKQSPAPAGAREQERGGMVRGSNPPEPIKATDIKVGDVITAAGETDEAAKSIGAVFVMQFDPERARQIRAMQANFGKTWLAGRVTAINETTVTIESPIDKANHTFVADENTTFRRRREPITLGDIQSGDTVRVEGAVKDGVFVASAVNVMMPPANGGPVKRPGEAPR